MLAMEFADAFINLFHSDSIRIPHRPATVSREAVAVDVNDVNVHGAQGEAFLEYARAFVDQRIDATLHDLVTRDLSLGNSGFSSAFAHQFRNFRIGNQPPLGIVFIPARASLLAVAALLAQVVFSDRLAHSGFLQMTIFLSNSPADIESGKIAGSERPHGHTEVIECLVYGFHASALFYQELGFTTIGMEHSVADKAAAITYKHTHLAQLPGELHAGCDDFLVGCFAAHNFQKTHDVGGTEEMRADH